MYFQSMDNIFPEYRQYISRVQYRQYISRVQTIYFHGIDNIFPEYRQYISLVQTICFQSIDNIFSEYRSKESLWKNFCITKLNFFYFENPRFFYIICMIFVCFCFTLYTKRKCSQLKAILNIFHRLYVYKICTLHFNAETDKNKTYN